MWDNEMKSFFCYFLKAYYEIDIDEKKKIVIKLLTNESYDRQFSFVYMYYTEKEEEQ